MFAHFIDAYMQHWGGGFSCIRHLKICHSSGFVVFCKWLFDNHFTHVLNPYSQDHMSTRTMKDDRMINCINTMMLREDGCCFPDDILKRIFLNGNFLIPIKISLKFVPRGPINNIAALVQIMVWRLPGNKPLSEPMMGNLRMHIRAIQPQWVEPQRSAMCL